MFHRERGQAAKDPPVWVALAGHFRFPAPVVNEFLLRLTYFSLDMLSRILGDNQFPGVTSALSAIVT